MQGTSHTRPGYAKTNGIELCYETFGNALDDVSDLKPTTHYWVQSAQTWVPLPGDAELVQQE